MGDAMTAMKFEDQELPDLDDAYVRLAEQFIPGRQAIFAIVEASLLELLPKDWPEPSKAGLPSPRTSPPITLLLI